MEIADERELTMKANIVSLVYTKFLKAIWVGACTTFQITKSPMNVDYWYFLFLSSVFTQCKAWVNLDQKAIPEYIKLLANHIKEVLIGTSDQSSMQPVFDENKINKIYQHAKESVCSAIVEI